MLIQKYQVAYRTDNTPLIPLLLFDRPIDAENYITTMSNYPEIKNQVIVIPVFVVE